MKKSKIIILLVLAISLVASLKYCHQEQVPRPDLDLPLAPQMTEKTDVNSIPNLPPKNTFLAEGVNPMPHGEPAQQDVTAIAGPIDVSKRLSAGDITYVHLGPGYFGAFTSNVYPNGERILWANGVNGLYKLDEETYEIYDHFETPVSGTYSEEWANEFTVKLNKNNGATGIPTAIKAMSPLKDLSGVYIMVGKNNWVYIADNDGIITAYGDAIENDPTSEIVVKATFQLPPEASGPSVGMNMTFDGWIIIPAENGYLAAVSSDLTEYRIIRLKHADTEDISTQGVGYGWVRNSAAIDDAGGIYLASRNHMHKVVWTGDKFSINEGDGAWTAKYRNGTGNGTGATPSLMGFGEEDKFVVITDGDIRMNVTLFWRDGIPENWQSLPDAPSRRIAGQAPVNMGELNIEDIQTEQSVVVAGYGAMVVNNRPRNVPFFFPKKGRALSVLIGPFGNNPKFQPFGVQKFQWNPQVQRLEQAWVNTKVSSPNGVPWVSLGSNHVYFIGARDNEWTLEALDWSKGQSTFHYIIGDQKYNSLYSGINIDDEGRIFYGTLWGFARLNS